MKNRECPYCHKKVSLRKCIKYIIRGTKYSTTCNHCGQQLWLEKEPLPFMYCVSAGFFIMYLPMQFFLYYRNLGFIDSVLYCLPIAVVSDVIFSNGLVVFQLLLIRFGYLIDSLPGFL